MDGQHALWDRTSVSDCSSANSLMFLLHFPNVWAVVLSCELNMYCLYAVRSLLYHVADLQQITSTTNRCHIREVWRAVAEGCLCPGLTGTVVKHCVVLWQMGGNTLQTLVLEAYEESCESAHQLLYSTTRWTAWVTARTERTKLRTTAMTLG